MEIVASKLNFNFNLKLIVCFNIGSVSCLGLFNINLCT